MTSPASPRPRGDAGASYWGTPVWRNPFEGDRVDPKKGKVGSRTDFGLRVDAGIPGPGRVAGTLAAFWLRDSQSDEIDIMEPGLPRYPEESRPPHIDRFCAQQNRRLGSEEILTARRTD